jgi:TetR/AcrR family transcriptional regulator
VGTRVKDSSRARILAAAPEVLRRTGLVGFGLGEVAKSAGVARQTIYNHFAGRDELLADLLVQEMLSRHVPLQAELGARPPSVDNLVALFLMELDVGHQYPLFEDMLSPTSAPRMAELIFHSEAVTKAREAAWLPILTRYADAGLLRHGLDHHEVVRWITYQQFWFLTHPDTLCPDDPASLDHMIRTYLIPGLVVDS